MAEVGGGLGTIEQNLEKTAAFGVLFYLTLLLCAYMMAYVLRRSHFEFLQEAGATILIGGIAGFLVWLASTFGLVSTARISGLVQFDKSFFFVVLLPPIIFESGYNMQQRRFFANIISVISFAFAGTLVSALIFGVGIFAVGRLGLCFQLTLIESFLYGSLISATDPVTVLAIFKELRADPDLYSNVFGESVLNDAVALVLYDTVKIFLVEAVTVSSIISAVVSFCVIFVGSIVIGIAMGVCSALLLKYTEMFRYSTLEMLILIVFAEGSYLLSQVLGMSGIVTVMFCGMTMAHYTKRNLSPETAHLSKEFFEVVAFLAESFVFVYLGVGIFNFEFIRFSLTMIFWSMLLMLVGRAVHIFPLSYLVNLVQPTKVALNHQVMMWFVGLRGGVAFAIALERPTANGDVILSTTIAVVLVTVLLFGGLTIRATKILGVKTGVEAAGDDPKLVHSTGKVGTMWEQVDGSWVTPFLIKGGSNGEPVPLAILHHHSHADRGAEAGTFSAPLSPSPLSFDQPSPLDQANLLAPSPPLDQANLLAPLDQTHLRPPSQTHVLAPSPLDQAQLRPPSQTHLPAPSPLDQAHLLAPSPFDQTHLLAPPPLDQAHLRAPSQTHLPSPFDQTHLLAPLDQAHLRAPSQTHLPSPFDQTHLLAPPPFDQTHVLAPSPLDQAHLLAPSLPPAAPARPDAPSADIELY